MAMRLEIHHHHAANLYAGTQIVSLGEIRGTNNSHGPSSWRRFGRDSHAEKTGDQNQFLVRFPAVRGNLSSPLTREQIDILKHFK